MKKLPKVLGCAPRVDAVFEVRLNETPAYLTLHDYPTVSDFAPSPTVSSKPSVDQTFEQEMATVYASLAEGQKPLGSDFEAVWFDNVHRLYES